MSPAVGTFFHWLLRASWQAGILVLLILAAQWLFGKKLGARWRHALWLVVLVRLALPFSPASAFSLFNFAPLKPVVPAPAPAVMPAARLVAGPQPQGAKVRESQVVVNAPPGPPDAEYYNPGLISVPAEAPKVEPAKAPLHWFRKLNVPLLCAWLWAAGVALLLVRIVGQNVVFLRGLRSARMIGDGETLALFGRCQAALGVRARIRLAETAQVKSPALCGLARPWLLLPAGLTQRFGPAELRHIFLHELAHVKRRDMAVHWAATALQVLHWFNPILWLGFRRLAADREVACDELALSLAGDRESRPYGETIIKLLELCARPSAAPGLLGILEDKNQIERRIAMIAGFKRHSRWSLPAIALLLVLGVVGLTDARPRAIEAKTYEPDVLFEQDATASGKTNENLEETMRNDQATIAAYENKRQEAAAAIAALEKDRRQAAGAIFRLGEGLRQLGKTAEANAQYQRIVSEFPDQTPFADLSQQYLLNLPNPPPYYVFSIGDVVYPGGVAVDSVGNVYVSDTQNNRIKKFTGQGELLTQWGGPGNDPGSFNYPQGLAIDAGNNLYVADVDNHRIQKFSADGTFLKQWGELGSGPGQFNRPYNVAVDTTGNVYVADNKNNRVQKFTGEGVFLKEFGATASDTGPLQAPQGVAVDRSGNIYVGDGGNSRIQIFNPEGVPVAGWVCPNHDVAVDARGNVYVVSGDCVKMFSATGNLLTQWGSKGIGPGQFDFAARVAVDPAGSKVFVTDAQNNRVQLFAFPPPVSNVPRRISGSNEPSANNVAPDFLKSTTPQPQVLASGQTATFSVTAAGTAPLSYQWRLNTNIPGTVLQPDGKPSATVGVRSLTGKLALNHPEKKVDWTHAHVLLYTRPPVAIYDGSFPGAWLNADLATRHVFRATVAADGTFRIENVPSGDYGLSAEASGNAAQPRPMNGPPPFNTIASVVRDVVVPEMTGGSGDGPLDLGTVELVAYHKPVVGEMAALFETTRVKGVEMDKDVVGGFSPTLSETIAFDDHPLKLADYRGKFVLLDLEQYLPGKQGPFIEAVSKTWAGDDRLIIITLFPDVVLNMLKAPFPAGRNWLQGDLGNSAKTTWLKDYYAYWYFAAWGGFGGGGSGGGGTITSLPEIFLIGPDGKFLAVNLSGDDIAKALTQALGKPK